MEIAHAQTKVLRVIGKIVLLGVVVILLAKVFLALLALAVVGLLFYVAVRALYSQRTLFKRFLFWTKERLIHSVAELSQAGAVTRLAARRTSCLFLTLAENLLAFIVVVCALIGQVTKVGCLIAWKSARKLERVMTTVFSGFFCHSKKSAVAVAQATVGALARIRSQSGVIFGTLVEASSGALIGAMLGFVPSFLPHQHSIEARVWGAALFGAFLGITVGLSRTTWAKRGEQSHSLENQN